MIRHAYDDGLSNMGIESADAVFLCAGALRGDTVYGPGGHIFISFRDITCIININNGQEISLSGISWRFFPLKTV